jgi:hypothetical protein
MADNFDDSDDDILGLTDTPIMIRSGNTTVTRANIANKFSKNGITGTMSDNSSIIDAPRNPALCHDGSVRLNKYKHMREIYNVNGFIVNIHDATNFDIDLSIPAEIREKYSDVIVSEYKFKDMDDDFLENPLLETISQKPEQIGITYRCRLRGVGINQNPIRNHKWRMNQVCVDVKQLIDRCDNWVTCTISDIDVYRRLLVDITIHTSTGSIILSDFLLRRNPTEENQLFYPYVGKRMAH